MARRLITALSLAALALPAPAAMASDIFTVAGTGVPGFAGDGGRATAAELHYPSDVEPTADGGYLIADYSNRVVRRVSATGKIKTVAGTPGVGGHAGDGGRATSALLSGPTAVTETRDGGFLIADVTNHCIRKVSPTGIITTVAGTGVAGRGRDRRPATSSALRKPGGVAVASDKSSILMPTAAITASAEWRPTARSRLWPAPARRATQATAARLPRHSSTCRWDWRLRPMAAS